MKKELKVIYFSKSYTTHDYRFLSFLSAQGFEVYFLTLENNTDQKENRFLPEKVKIIPTPNSSNKPFGAKKFAKLFSKIIREINPDLIHAGPLQSCAYITSLTKFQPYVAMSWGSDLLIEADENRVSKRITKQSLLNANSFVGDCDAVKNKAIQYGVLDKNTSIFPWGIDLDKFSPNQNSSIKERLGWQDNFVVMHSRSWESIYNVENFIKGFVSAYQKNNDLRLLLLGNGSKSNKIKSIIHNTKLQNVVHFAGQISQESLPDYYQTADLYVSASLSDGSSVSLMEALASGKPCLVSNIPGNQEWITSNKQGWLFDPLNIDEITDGILSASRNENLSEFKIEARKTAEQKADWKINSHGILKAYQIAIESVA